MSSRRVGNRRRQEVTRRRDRALRDGAGTTPAGSLDGGLVVSAAILAIFGVVMVYSATAPLAMGTALAPQFTRHTAVVVLGIVCAGVVLHVPTGLWRRLAVPLWGVCVVALLATLGFGAEVKGASRWLVAPGIGIGFQPAEPTKWASLLAVAAVLANGGANRRTLLLCLGLTAIPTSLLLLQPDFGSAVVLIAVVGLQIFVAGTPLRLLAAPAAVCLCGAAAYIAFRPYALARWTGFLHPWQTSRDEGFQLVQSFVAFGRGGTTGVGLGDGRQKLFYLPEAHTDFILSVVAEELGLLGVLVVLGAFAGLVVAGTRIAARARDPFAMLLAFGMTSLIAVPAAVNAGVVMGLLPTTGFTLPFLSFGGTSIVICSVALGILLRIAAHESGSRRRRWGRS